MTPEAYKTERQRRGTQQGVAAMLGVDYRTIQRREAGEIEITREAQLALLALPRSAGRRGQGGVPRNRGAKK